MESFPIIHFQNAPSRAQVCFEKLQFRVMVQMPPLRWKETLCVCIFIKFLLGTVSQKAFVIPREVGEFRLLFVCVSNTI